MGNVGLIPVVCWMTDLIRLMYLNYGGMSGEYSSKPKIKVQIVVREDCLSCAQTHEDLDSYCRSRESLSLEVVDLDKGETPPGGRQSCITPAIWVNKKLWYLGGFDIDRFHERINQLFYNVLA